MKRRGYPLSIYVAVAAAIAGLAAVGGQILPGMGVAIAAGGSMMWVAFNVRRFGRINDNG